MTSLEAESSDVRKGYVPCYVTVDKLLKHLARFFSTKQNATKH